MRFFTDEQIEKIQSEYRKFPHYPTVAKLATEMRSTVNDIIDVINLNERIGAFIYRESVYTWRHVRQFRYLLVRDTPKFEIMDIMGIGSGDGWSLFMQKAKEWDSIEKGMSGCPEKIKENIMEENNMAIEDINDPIIKRIIELTEMGRSQRSIADQIGKSKSYVQYVQAELRDKGVIEPLKKKPKKANKKTKKGADKPQKEAKPKKTEKPTKIDKSDEPKKSEEKDQVADISNEEKEGISFVDSNKTVKTANDDTKAEPASPRRKTISEIIRDMWMRIGNAIPGDGDETFSKIEAALAGVDDGCISIGLHTTPSTITYNICGGDILFTVVKKL